jgi:hypothetical protein
MSKLHKIAEGLLVFHCPGCGYDHPLHVAPQRRIPAGPLWNWNGSMTSPTFTPSLVVFKDDPKSRCHSFVTDGRIWFLEDSFHALRGQTVDLPEYEDD